MKKPTLFLLAHALGACASISGAQTFEAKQQFALPAVGAVAGATGSRTIAAVGAADQLSFAESVLEDVEQLRSRDYIDSAEASVRVVSVQLTTDTTFAGVAAVRLQLVTATQTIELCNRTLSAEEQNTSSLRCVADQVIDEATLQAAPARVGAELEVSGTMTARKLDSVVTLEVEVEVDASL